MARLVALDLILGEVGVERARLLGDVEPQRHEDRGVPLAHPLEATLGEGGK